MKKISLILIVIVGLIRLSVGQVDYIYNDSIKVIDINGDTLNLPWVGGLSNVQFSEIDFS